MSVRARWLLPGLLGCQGGPTIEPGTVAPAKASMVERHATPPAGPGTAGGPPPSEPFHASPTFELEEAPDRSARSIVVISLDTVSAPILALYGGPAETPNLAALAARGTRFTDPATHFPETCLSHWTLLSGVLPEAHGNAPAHAGSQYTGPTMAEIARRAGYATGAVIGGVTLQDTACGLSRGFAAYDDQFALDPSDMRRPAAEVTGRAVQWLQRQEGPFFLFVHYFDAHFPYTPPAPWDTHYDPDYTGTLDGSDATLRPYRDGGKTPSARDVAHIEALYAGEVSALDEALEPLLSAIPEDTVVVVTADHGESFGHDYWFNHRGVLWDDVMRVPLVIAGLDRPAGQPVDGPVGLVDVARTVLAAAGLPADRRMGGRDLNTVDPAEVPVAQLAITDPWVGSAWFAARAFPTKRLERPDPLGVAIFQLDVDPGERTPSPNASGEELQSSRASWNHAVETWAMDQVDAPVRVVSDAEIRRLEALGYVDPTGAQSPPPKRPSPQRAPGKAPGARRGPPGGAHPPANRP